jgi:hypothetical protein
MAQRQLQTKHVVCALVVGAILGVAGTALGTISFYAGGAAPGSVVPTGSNDTAANVNQYDNYINNLNKTVARTVRLQMGTADYGTLKADTGYFTLMAGFGAHNAPGLPQWVGRSRCYVDFNMYGNCYVTYN